MKWFYMGFYTEQIKYQCLWSDFIWDFILNKLNISVYEVILYGILYWTN